MSTRTPTFGLHHRLALALEASGVTREEMAAELGVHINTVHNYASGRSTPKRGDLVVWANKCQVSLEWITEADTVKELLQSSAA